MAAVVADVQECSQQFGPAAASRLIQLTADPISVDMHVVPTAVGPFVVLGLQPLDGFSGKVALTMYWSVRSLVWVSESGFNSPLPSDRLILHALNPL